MPGKPRSEIMDPTRCGTYHITTRCVRRDHLFGSDRRSGQDYNYRRKWIERRTKHLAASFAIDVFFVCLMGSHFHLMLRNLPQVVKRWSDEEVIRRSCLIFPYKFRKLGVDQDGPTPEQLRKLAADKRLVQTMRERLCDPSWFMRQLNHYIARRANQEDGVSGHFFESRFHSREILDDVGVLVCGIYIDLNQIAARESDSPETSVHTSAYMRIQGRQARLRGSPTASQWDGFLAPISSTGDGQNYPPAAEPGSARASDSGILETSLGEYLRLLDWAGRRMRPGKRGRIAGDLPPILERLDLGTEEGDGEAKGELLTSMVEQYETLFGAAVGTVESLDAHAARLGQRWVQQRRALAALMSSENS